MNKLEKLTEKEYPESIKDYCYTEGCPTLWYKQKKVYREHIIEGIYKCSDCEQERNYVLTPRSLREVRA